MADPANLELVVVAIPDNDDPVWKVSSEKIPHMTLLYLGSPDWSNEQFVNVAQYVQHAAAQQPKFGMSVRERGVLGAQSADVLFFEKTYSYEKMLGFIGNLRANQDIDKAYLAASQYPSWTPHLTLLE